MSVSRSRKYAGTVPRADLEVEFSNDQKPGSTVTVSVAGRPVQFILTDTELYGGMFMAELAPGSYLQAPRKVAAA
jgi:hypothetical protein